MNPSSNRRTAGYLAVFAVCLCATGYSVFANDSDPVVCNVEGGLSIDSEGLEGWTELLLLASPEVASGDVDQTSRIIKSYAARFSTVLAAKVSKSSDRFQLSAIGIGMAVSNGKDGSFLTVRTDDDSSQLGVIETRVLASAEQIASKIVVIAKNQNSILFDIPAVIETAKGHQDAFARHLIRVSNADGKVHSAIWFLNEQKTVVVDNNWVHLESNFRETRKLHVDQSQFTFGIPGKKAFALETLPGGKCLEASESLRSMMSGQLQSGQLAALVNAIATENKSLRK